MPKETRESLPVPDAVLRRERTIRRSAGLGDPGLSRVSSVSAVIEAAKVVGVSAADIAEGLDKGVHEIRERTIRNRRG